MSNPFSDADSFSTIDFELMNSPSKSGLSPISYTIPALLSTPALHKRRPAKRVRFALTLEPVEEDSLLSSPEVSPSVPPKRIKRTIEPGPQSRPVDGNCTEYVQKQGVLKHPEMHVSRTPSPKTSPQPATYTHTFVIQSKSPAIFIDSITVSTPPVHLPQIIHRGKKPARSRPTTVDSHVKQQPTLSIPPRTLQPKKLADATSQRHHYISIRAVPQRAESTIHASSGSQLNHRATPTNNLFRSKTVKDHPPSKKIVETTMSKAPTNQANYVPDRSNPSHYPRKTRLPSRVHRASDELNLNNRYLFRNGDSGHLLPSVVHFTH